MRILLLSVMLSAAAACEYSPAPGGTAQAPYAAQLSAATPDTPNANAPRGDVFYETYITRYDLTRDR